MVVGVRKKFLSCTVRIAVVVTAIALFTVDAPTQSGAPLPYGVTEVGTFGGAVSVAQDISDFGQVTVGRAQISSGAYHAMVQGYFGRRDLGTFGGRESLATAVSGSHVVGQAQLSSGEMRAFFQDLAVPAGTKRNLGTLGGSWSAAYDVRYGIVVGASRTTGDTRLRAFQYVNGAMTPVAFDWGGDSIAYGVNSSHEITGEACTAGNARCHAFVFSGGVATDIGSLGGRSIARAINESAQVVGGSFLSASVEHAFLYSGGTMMDLGTLGGTNSDAFAINERGHVVGSSESSSGGWRAFLWRDGVMTDLNTFLPPGSGWVLQSANSITDGGQIVGFGVHNGAVRGFILTPPVDLGLFIGGVRSQSDSNLPRGIEVGKQVTWVTSVQALAGEGVTVYGATLRHTLTGPAEFVDARADEGDTCDVTPTVVTCHLTTIDSPGVGRETLVVAKATGPGPITHRATITTNVPDPNTANNTITEANRAIALSTLALTPSTLAGGNISAARVTLTDRAPAGDAIVHVTSSRPDIAPVPSTFIVPSWTNTRTFNIRPAVVSQPTTVQISATYGEVTVTQTLTVVPPTLRQLYLAPTTVIGGCGTSAGKILLTGAAPAGGAVVPLTNTNAKANVPATVTVAAGQTSKTFTVTTQAVTSLATGTVTARYGGVSQTLNLSVRPIRVKTLTFVPNPARGGTTVRGTITLECPAAPGTVVVSLSSSNQTVARPAVTSVTIPAGTQTASFTIQTTAVTANTNVSIYATAFGVRKSATLTITP